MGSLGQGITTAQHVKDEPVTEEAQGSQMQKKLSTYYVPCARLGRHFVYKISFLKNPMRRIF